MGSRIKDLLFEVVAGLALSCIYTCFKLVHNLYATAPSFSIPGGEALFLSSFASLSAGYILCLFCAVRFDKPSIHRAIHNGGLGAFLTGTTVASIAGATGQTPLFYIGSVVGQIGAAFTLVSWIELLAAVPAEAAKRIALFQVLATLAGIFSYYLPHEVRLAFCLSLPPICIAGLIWCRHACASPGSAVSEKPLAPASDYPSATVYDGPALGRMLSVGLGIFAVWVCIGFSRSIVNIDLGASALARNLIWGEALSVLAAAVMVATHSDHLFERSFKGIVFASMFGFLFLYLPIDNNAYLGGVPIATASSFCQTIAMLFAASIARKRHGSASIPGAGFFIFLSGGLAVGMGAAQAMLSRGFGPGTDYYAFISTSIVIILTVAALWFLGEHGIDMLLWSRAPEHPAKPSGSSTAASKLAHSLGASFGLTGREEEVLCLVLTGRTTSYISEALSISRNTVNTHIKHLYQKIGIHDRQELLDFAYARETADTHVASPCGARRM